MELDGLTFLATVLLHSTRNGNWYFLKKEGSVYSMIVKNANGVNIHKAFKNLKEATKYITGE